MIVKTEIELDWIDNEEKIDDAIQAQIIASVTRELTKTLQEKIVADVASKVNARVSVY